MTVNVNRCKTCCMPDTRPDTPFVDGECQACINYRNRKNVDWGKRHQLLLDTLERVKGKVIVASSGGKDSTYIALRLKELGADVTAVTATTCHLTAIGRANIDNLARHVRTIEVTPNMAVRAKLNRLALEWVGDPSWPEHVSIHRVPFKVAVQTSHHAIFYGEAPTNQYGGPQGREDEQVMTQRWASEFAGFLGLRASDFVGVEGITARDMADYEAPTDAELEQADVTAYFLGWFEQWCSSCNAQIALKSGLLPAVSVPCKANLWSWENLDNAQTHLHDHLMWRKYGYGRGCAQASTDVRIGEMERNEAMRWVGFHDGLLCDKYMGVPLEAILARIGLTRAQFLAIADRFTNREIHVPVREQA